MKDYFDKSGNCSVLSKEVNVTGYWKTHESSTTAKPEIDLAYLTEFKCDHMSICGRKQDCPLRKEMQAEKNI